MKIKVKLTASEEYGRVTFSLDELDLTEKEWKRMSEEEKLRTILKAIDELSEHPYWFADYFDEEDE
jgi:hypothetical protein